VANASEAALASGDGFVAVSNCDGVLQFNFAKPNRHSLALT